MGTSPRLDVHLGCGNKIWPGFVNVDQYAARADVRCDCTALTFETGSVDSLYAVHLLEHLHRQEAGKALTDWVRVLKPGGTMVLELPCLNKIAQMIVDGETDMRMTVLGLYGDPRDPAPAMLHKWGWSREELTEALTQAGMEQVAIKEPVFHFPKRDMRVEARKPS